MLLRTLTALTAVTLIVPLLTGGSTAHAHCQVPCGIYHDNMRVEMMREDLTTISKAVGEIKKLAGKNDPQSKNQLVRWINTKENHAERIIRIISDYFMAQKIKPETKGKAGREYQKKLALHHQVMVAAMKCKQQADGAAVQDLERALNAIAGYWPKKHRH